MDRLPRAYNVGWFGSGKDWGYQLARDADLDFEETAAHEIGHQILSAYRLWR